VKKDKWPKHKAGKRCGYDEFEDGSISIAPMYSDMIEKILVSEAAIDSLLQAVTAQCHRLLIPLTEEKRNFWSSVKEDYGLDFDGYTYCYNSLAKRICRDKKKG
jgi:hypothetical protein